MLAAYPDVMQTDLFDTVPAIPAGLRQGLFSYSQPVAALSFTALLDQAPPGPRLFWESTPDEPALVGWGLAAELTAAGDQRFSQVSQQARRLFAELVRLAPEAPEWSGPRLLGGFAFQPGSGREAAWRAFPDARFILPRIQFTRLGAQTWLTVNHLVAAPTPAQEIQAALADSLAEAQHILSACQDAWPLFGSNTTQPVEAGEELPYAAWRAMVANAVERIQAGEFEKVVLARTLQVRLPAAPQAGVLLEQLGQRYPDCYRFLVEPEAGQVFLGATPELLVKVERQQFATTALAGTARRGATPESDRAAGQALLDSAKDRREQAIVVEAIRQKLAPLAAALEIPAAPGLRKLSNVQHLETPLRGRLAQGYSLLDLVAALHPTPALGGWPEPAARRYLEQAEPFERGWYAAPLGWLDSRGAGVFAVAIRSGLLAGRGARLFAGAGIVAGSDPEREWQETGLKFRPMLEALGGAARHG